MPLALRRLAPVLALLAVVASAAEGQRPRRIFISVDMEGIGGIGTGAMTSSSGKDYALGRRLMTDEVNAVVEAIFRAGPAEVLINDSHGDMQNLLHAELDPRVTYLQGSIKPHGMVEGLDSTFDAAIFLGYHARAGTPEAFLAHTGSGIVKGLWIDGEEVGEGGMNALFARSMGVPVILASGDSAFVREFSRLSDAVMVATKTAVTPQSALLRHPQAVREELAAATARALQGLSTTRHRPARGPVRVRLRFADTTRPQILRAIPGVEQEDGYTVAFAAPDAAAAYRLIRLMYRFVDI